MIAQLVEIDAARPALHEIVLDEQIEREQERIGLVADGRQVPDPGAGTDHEVVLRVRTPEADRIPPHARLRDEAAERDGRICGELIAERIELAALDRDRQRCSGS